MSILDQLARWANLRRADVVPAIALLFLAPALSAPAPEMTMKTVHYRFHPRYTAGSPGNWFGGRDTDQLFERLIAQEREQHERYLEGIYGEAAKEAAAAVGLSGIAEARTESGRGKRRGWLIHDLITDERHHVVSGDPMSEYEERQHKIARYVAGHGECRWCGSDLDLALDSVGDLVCAGCHDARETMPPLAWCEDVARAFRKHREHMSES